MKSQEYTIGVINNLVETFDKIKCSYEFDEFTDTHYVEIVPLSEYELNDKLNDALDDIYFEFIELFEKESLAFLSNEGERRLSKIIFERAGLEFSKSLSSVWVLNDIQSYVNIQTVEDEFYQEEDYSLAA